MFEVAFFEIAEDFPIGHFCDGAHSVGEEDAVEVVGFVLPDAGEIAGFGLFEGVAGEILGVDADGFVAEDVDVDFGQGEAAFFVFFVVLGVAEEGIDVDAVVGGITVVVHDEEAEVFPYLRGGETDSFVFAHDLEHRGGEVCEVLVEMGDRGADFFQSRIGPEDDF